MARKQRVCHSGEEFEELFLPVTHEKKRKQQGLREPGKFGKDLEDDLIRSMTKER